MSAVGLTSPGADRQCPEPPDPPFAAKTPWLGLRGGHQGSTLMPSEAAASTLAPARVRSAGVRVGRHLLLGGLGQEDLVQLEGALLALVRGRDAALAAGLRAYSHARLAGLLLGLRHRLQAAQHPDVPWGRHRVTGARATPEGAMQLGLPAQPSPGCGTCGGPWEALPPELGIGGQGDITLYGVGVGSLAHTSPRGSPHSQGLFVGASEAPTLPPPTRGGCQPP